MSTAVVTPVYAIPPTVARALEAVQEVIGIFGPVATGKTLAVCLYVYAHARKYAVTLAGQTIRWLFVRATYESLRATSLKTWLELFPAPRFGTWNEAKKQYTLRLPKGQRAEILFMGLDDAKDVGKLLSLDLSGAVVDEPAGGIVEGGVVQPGIPEYVYKGLVGRLRHPIGLTRRRLIVLGNPPSTAHWCHRIFRPDLAQPHGATLVVDVPQAEAPILTAEPEYYTKLEAKLGPGSPDAQRYCHGVWLKSLLGGFHRDLVRVIPRDAVPARLAMGATCDPAAGGKSGAGDRSAIAIAGFTPDGTAYVFDLIAGRLPEQDLLARIFETQQKYALGAFGFERVAFQAWLAFMIEQERKLRITDGRPAPLFNLVELPRDSHQKKETRIQGSLGVRFANERIFFVEGCSNLDVLYAEMESFPDGETDDVLDALSDLDQIARIAMPAFDVGQAAAAPSASTPAAAEDGRFWARPRGSFWGRGAAA